MRTSVVIQTKKKQVNRQVESQSCVDEVVAALLASLANIGGSDAKNQHKTMKAKDERKFHMKSYRAIAAVRGCQLLEPDVA